MILISDFSKAIASFRKNKQYQEAIVSFDENNVKFNIDQIASDEYIVSDMLACYRYANRFFNAFEFMKAFNIQIDNQTTERVLVAYSWLLSDFFKSESNTANDSSDILNQNVLNVKLNENIVSEKSDLLVRVETAIMLLQISNSDFSVPALEALFKVVLQVEKKKSKPSWSFMAEFCMSIDPEKLSTNVESVKVIRKGKEVEVKKASAREEWYAYVSKALYLNGDYDRCYMLSKKALESFDTFHAGSDMWFYRRMALCKIEVGSKQDAIVELEAILQKNRDWFIRKKLADILLELGEREKAYSQVMLGITSYGDLEQKVELIELLADLLLKKGEVLLSYKHYALAKLICESNKWKMSEELQEQLISVKGMPIYKLSDKSDLLTELTQFWYKSDKKVVPKNVLTHKMPVVGVRQTGVVKKLLLPKEEGKSGFITKDTGTDIFFFLTSSDRLYNELKEGLKVSFETIEDRKGKRDRAVKLKSLQ